MASVKKFKQGESVFDEIMHAEDDGTEWWSAREMRPRMGYSRWENVQSVLERAKAACRNSGHDPSDHFRDVTQMVPLGSGAFRKSVDTQMDRFGCYLLAMNGDPTKPEIAAAQRYFVIATRANEIGVSAETVQQAAGTDAAPKALARPWSARFTDTYESHIRDLNVNHFGCFTVVSTLVGQMLSMEDMLLRHEFPLRPSDRPDVSIGRCWSEERKRRGLPTVARYAVLRLPDQERDVELLVYDNSERGDFEAWFARTYLTDKLPAYYHRKPEFRPFGSLPSASAADNTARRLTGRPANLKVDVRRQLTACGNFAPVGMKVPELTDGQRSMFGMFE